MNDLAQSCIIGRFLAKKWVFNQDEHRPICLACCKSMKFVKYFEILRKQINLGYCPSLYAYYVKFSTIYLLSSNL